MTETARYLYIDDQPVAEISDLKKRLERETGGRLTVDIEGPRDFAQMLAYIEEKKPNGILLDNRLSEHVGEHGPQVYSGTALAQQIRNFEVEGKGGDAFSIPVVLLSVPQNLRQLFERDRTVWDLFDRELDKEALRAGDSKVEAERLVQLVLGYGKLRDLRGKEPREFLVGLLGGEEAVDDADPRLLRHLHDSSDPCHSIAQIVIKDLLDHPGMLIDEAYLAARLGVDIQQSPDWEVLCERHLEPGRYKGVFSGGWKRWWATWLENWWLSLSKANRSLRVLPAASRVEQLRRSLNLTGLAPALPSRAGAPSRFWAVSRGTNLPLDLDDAVREWEAIEHKVWQEARYVSFEEIVNGTRKPHPHDRQRIERWMRERGIEE